MIDIPLFIDGTIGGGFGICNKTHVQVIRLDQEHILSEAPARTSKFTFVDLVMNLPVKPIFSCKLITKYIKTLEFAHRRSQEPKHALPRGFCLLRFRNNINPKMQDIYRVCLNLSEKAYKSPLDKGVILVHEHEVFSIRSKDTISTCSKSPAISVPMKNSHALLVSKHRVK